MLERWRACTSQYPVFRQLKCTILRTPRLRFPPNAPEKLGNYRPTPDNPVQYSWMQCSVAAFVAGGILGSVVASSMELHKWSGLFMFAFAAFSCYDSTVESRAGDLVRCIAMKCAAIFNLFLAATTETEVPTKTLALGGRLYRWGVAFNTKYRVSANVSRIFGDIFNRVMDQGGDGRNDSIDPVSTQAFGGTNHQQNASDGIGDRPQFQHGRAYNSRRRRGTSRGRQHQRPQHLRERQRPKARRRQREGHPRDMDSEGNYRSEEYSYEQMQWHPDVPGEQQSDERGRPDEREDGRGWY